MSILQFNKLAIRRTSFEEEGNDYEYWQSVSPLDRIKAIEFLRQQYHTNLYQNDHSKPRLQRVYRFIER